VPIEVLLKKPFHANHVVNPYAGLGPELALLFTPHGNRARFGLKFVGGSYFWFREGPWGLDVEIAYVLLFWDKLAERYAKQPIANLASYERKLEVTKSRLSPTDAILDIGCGTGSLALELAPHVAAVHALDFSGEMIKIGKSKASDQNVTNITFHQSTLEAAEEFQPGQFDGICAYNILHLVEDRGDTLTFARLGSSTFQHPTSARRRWWLS
jgi:SAM-dependent methyltransferase